MATTMKDVARRAGVDVSTVSLAINNDPRIRIQTRERILTIAHELGYQKNHLARGLRSGKSFTVGAVVAPTDRAWGEMLTGAQGVFAEQEYHLLLDIAATAARREEMQVEALRAKRVDGLLIAPMDGEVHQIAAHQLLYQAMQGVTPTVLMERTLPGEITDSVCVDNHAAGREAAQHLLGLGHRSIAFLSAPHRDTTAVQARQNGYREAMQFAGLPTVFWTADTPLGDPVEEGRAAIGALATHGGSRNITGLVAATDTLAVGALKAFYEAEQQVPNRIAVVSFGGAATHDLFPALTILSLPLQEVGRQAAILLMRRIEGDLSPAKQIQLPPQLRVGATCGAAAIK